MKGFYHIKFAFNKNKQHFMFTLKYVASPKMYKTNVLFFTINPTIYDS